VDTFVPEQGWAPPNAPWEAELAEGQKGSSQGVVYSFLSMP
jgi:hypothetical protein